MKIKIFNTGEYIVEFINPSHFQIKQDFCDSIYQDSEKNKKNTIKIDDNTTLACQIDNTPIGVMLKKNLLESDFLFFNRLNELVFFEKFKSFLNFSIHNLLHYLSDENEFFYDCFEEDFKFQSWYHITNNHGFHNFHNHYVESRKPLVKLCGIYIISNNLVNGVDGQLEFCSSDFYINNKCNNFFLKKQNDCLYEYYKPIIKEGKLFLFSPTLLHRALPYKNDKDRIVVAFNIFT